MIKNFDKETAPLNEYERGLAAIIANCFKEHHVGREKAVSSSKICCGMRRIGHRLDSARLRKIINYLRTSHTVKGLVANNEGYYIATTEQEMKDYALSLKERATAIFAVEQALSAQCRDMFQPQQLSLFG